jgi:hypothetical protein
MKSRRTRWAGHVAQLWKKTYRLLVRKPEGRRPLGRPRRRIKWAERVSRKPEERNAYRLLVGKSEGKRPVPRTTHIGRRIILRWILES